MKKVLIAVLLLSAKIMVAQCSHYAKTPVTTSTGQPVPFPSTRVCQEIASGTTCIPLVPGGLFSDRGCTQALPNPMTGDAQGNVDFYTPSLRVHLQINGAGINQIDISDIPVADPLQPVLNYQVVAFTANPAFDTSVSTIFQMTLTGNVTSSSIVNQSSVTVGRTILFKICQDGVGGRSFVWPASFLITPTVAGIGAGNCIDVPYWWDGVNWNPNGASSLVSSITLAGVGPGVAGAGTYDFSAGLLVGTNINGAAFNITTRGDRQFITQNPDFEGSSVIPPPGWQRNHNNETVNYETVSPAPGKLQSIKVFTTDQFGGIVSTVKTSVVAGDTYFFQAVAKADGSSIASLELCYYNKSGTNIACHIATTTAAVFTTVSGNSTVPANAVGVLVALLNNSVTQPSTVWFDQITIQKTNYPGPVTATIFNPSTGFQVNSTATSGHVLRGNGTNYVDGTLACGDLSNAAPSCSIDATIASNITSGILPAARLPNPSASTLGGIESLSAVSHLWINTISTSGVPSATRPACADLSDSTASCTLDMTNASNISSGTLAAARMNPSVAAHSYLGNNTGGSLAASFVQPVAGDLTPGLNGQCVVTSGGISVWGSCAGTAGEQLPVAPNTTTVTVNGNTAGNQFMQNMCSASPCYGTSVLNQVGKTIRLKGYGTLVPVNTTETIQLLVGMGGINIPMTGSGFVPPSVETYNWNFEMSCTVTNVASGNFTCGFTTTVIVNATSFIKFDATQTISLGVSLTGITLTPVTGVSFTTASVTNTASSIYTYSEQLN